MQFMRELKQEKITGPTSWESKNLEELSDILRRRVPGLSTDGLLHPHRWRREPCQHICDTQEVGIRDAMEAGRITLTPVRGTGDGPLHSGQPLLPLEARWAEHLGGLGRACNSLSSSSSSSIKFTGEIGSSRDAELRMPRLHSTV